MKRIIAATKNRHKIKEIEAITSQFGMNIISRDDAGVPDVEIPEDGDTFEENSYKKAYGIMELSGEITVADDSGLEVDYLDGAPGIYSARFAGEGATDDKNNEKLLQLMKDVPFEQRTARFVSVITMVFPDGKSVVARGTVEGHLAYELKGERGFGYDPMFIPEGYSETMGEISGEEKNRISHRANALKVLREKLREEFGDFEASGK
ncbi:MAG: XTP/dITP diphosphatase [Firmicutes bacterium]|nr:XTP/dITP diphosphatase [Bacillota bacterium]